jgi:PhnB protein
MIATSEVKVDKDLSNKKITVTKHFNAKPAAVWDAWTKQDILEKWWAPKPWRAESKKLDFKEGGSWLYVMTGPENQRQDAKFTYTKIHAPKTFEVTDSFTDEKGFVDEKLPQAHWKCEFTSSGAGTDVKVTITPKTEGALEKNLEMGFEEGFKMALGNLDEYLEQKQK